VIKRLRITGFQAHDLLDVTLDPSITTIVGDTDTGKSSIIRALRWLMLNKPRGDGFLRVGSKRMEVKGKVGDTTVQRKRSSSDNSYAMRADGEQQEYTAFGSDVPDAIRDAFGVTEVNFQLQHDAPYWFSLSPAEVGRQLNKIVDLEVIDNVSKRLAGRSRRLMAEIDVTNSRLLQAKTQEAELAYIVEMEKDLGALQVEEGLLEDRRNRLSTLRDVVMVVGSHESTVKEGRKLLANGTAVLRCGDRLKELGECVSLLQHIINTIRDLGTLAGTTVPDLRELDGQRVRVDSLTIRLRGLRELVRGITDCTKVVREGKRALAEAGAILDEEMQGICPVCGRKMP